MKKPAKPKQRFTRERLAHFKARLKASAPSPQPPRLTLPEFPPGVGPAAADKKMAMDEFPAMGWANQQFTGAYAASYWGNYQFSEGASFQGYPYLAMLANIPEYRVISSTIAEEMTRKWITIRSKSTDIEESDDEEDEDDESEDPAQDLAAGESPDEPDESEQQEPDEEGKESEEKSLKTKAATEKEEKIKAIEQEFERLQVRAAFCTVTEMDGWFGRAHLYLEVKMEKGKFNKQSGISTDIDGENKTPLGDGRDAVSQLKLGPGIGKLNRIKPVEPMWCYPSNYNASDPLADDWYRPTNWYVQSRDVHHSRLLTFVARPVPDMLKPSFSFGGLSLSQMAKPYVDNWLQTRQNVNALINAFSVMVLKTNLFAMQEAEGDEANARIEMFNTWRSNSGTFVIDKDTEDFANVSASLGSLDQLQAQAQEHMAAVSRIPLVKLLGIQPHGLNASSEGEIRVFYDNIAAMQERYFRVPLTTIFWMVQMSLWGQIDEDLVFDFNPLWELDEKSMAELRKVEAETAGTLIDKGVLAPEEDRKRLATDEDSPYSDIDVDDVPELKMEEMQGLVPKGGGKVTAEEVGGESPGGPPMDLGGGGGGGDDSALPIYDEDPTLTKQDANYRLKGSQKRRCALCTMFRADTRTCTLVKGSISASAVCDEFQARALDEASIAPNSSVIPMVRKKKR